MVHSPKRLGIETLYELNELICTEESKDVNKDDKDRNDKHNHGNPENNDNDKSESKSQAQDQNKVHEANQTYKGKLLLDTTCAPADLRYPTDLSLLNEGCEKLKYIIYTLHKPLRVKERKPRMYPLKTRKDYLTVAKCRKNSAKKLRKAVSKQLWYVTRDLHIIDALHINPNAGILSTKQQKELEVIHDLIFIAANDV